MTNYHVYQHPIASMMDVENDNWILEDNKVSKIVDKNGEPFICSREWNNFKTHFDESLIWSRDTWYYGKWVYFYNDIIASEMNFYWTHRELYFLKMDSIYKITDIDNSLLYWVLADPYNPKWAREQCLKKISDKIYLLNIELDDFANWLNYMSSIWQVYWEKPKNISEIWIWRINWQIKKLLYIQENILTIQNDILSNDWTSFSTEICLFKTNNLKSVTNNNGKFSDTEFFKE